MRIEKAGTGEIHTTESATDCVKESLEDFNRWAREIGHYHATEAVTRYRKMIKGDQDDL
jgi:hypothetical protein